MKARRVGNVPSPWVTGASSLFAASIFLVVPPTWGWGAVAIYFALYALMIAAVLYWSSFEQWNGLHVLSLAAGAALSYAWHAFTQNPVTGKADVGFRIGNAVLAAGTILLLAIAARRVKAASPSATFERVRELRET